jgi:ferrochelatase
MDGRVLDVNWFVRFCIVYFAILPKRPKESAHAYQSIWTSEGSPLVVISRKIRAALQDRVSLPIELAMRYQNPSIPDTVARLKGKAVDDLLLIPLFPHFAMSSFETAVARVKEVGRQIAPNMRIQVQPPFYAEPDYIAALVGSAREFLTRDFDHLLFSFHGIPERQVRKSDPTGRHCLNSPNCCDADSPALATCYRAQCFRTMAEFAKKANLPREKYSVSFQSRLGRHPWLKPYTDFELPRLAQSGVRKMLVISPAFVADCLETIEEIGMRGRQSFLDAGGTEFSLIPCMNEHPLWLDALEKMVRRFSG